LIVESTDNLATFVPQNGGTGLSLTARLTAVAEAIKARRNAGDARGGDFLTVEEVAAELKVSRGTVRTWITAGALRASRPGVAGRDGRVYRIAQSDLESFLETKRNVPRDDIDIKAEASRIVAEMARKRKP
jgi:excisionase family DNA binding protein